MRAFKRGDEGDPVTQEPVVSRSGVVPAMTNSSIPKLWDDADGDDDEITGPTSLMTASPPKKSTPHLTIMTGIGAGRVISFDGRSHLVIGRSRSVDVPLPDEGISRRHCVVVRRNSSVFVEDLGSTNGTIVNGARSEVVELKPGDRIQLGPKLILQFGMFDETEESLARLLFDGLTRDMLTRAFNRRNFDERLAAEIGHGQRHKAPLSVLVVGIDDLRALNDASGRAAGDEVLKTVAGLLGDTVRTSDVCCRYSGTKFALLVREKGERAARLAERLRAQIATHRVWIGTKHINITVSIGVAEVGERGAQLSGEGLVRVALKRLERARGLGRNRVCAE